MVKTCRSGYKLVGNRCIKISAASTPSAPNTGAGFTSGGVPIVSADNPELASKLYGATSVKRGDALDGDVSGVEKLQKQQYIAAGGSKKTGTTSVNQFAQNQVATLPKATTSQDYSYIEAAAPKMGDTEDPKDYQIRVANWEKTQALKQANAIAEETKNIRAMSESEQRTDREELFQQKGKESDLGTVGGIGKKINPEYTNLSTEEKRFNATLPEDEQVKEYVEFSESSLSAEQKAARAKGINVRLTDDQKEAVYEGAKVNTFIDPATGKTKVGATEAHLFKVKEFLGAETGDRVEMREDGTYYLKDEEGEEVDPIKRAEAKVQEEAVKAQEALDEQFRISSDSIKNQHRTPSGGIDSQGKDAMQKLQTKYNTANEELADNVDDALEEAITTEKSRQIDVDTQLAALKSKTTLSFAEEVSQTKVTRLNELKAQGVDPMVALAQVEREYALMKSDPDKIKLNEFISGLDRSGVAVEDQFSRVYAEAGNNTDTAYTAMKARYGEYQAGLMRDEFLAKNNWGEKQIERKRVKAQINDFWAGEVTDPDMVGNFMDQLDELGYSDDFKQKQLNAMIISPTLNENVKDEARALLKEDYSAGTTETLAQLEARYMAGDMDPEEATDYLKRKDLLDNGISSSTPIAGVKESALLRVKTGRITNLNMDKMEARAAKEGWIDEFSNAVKLGKPISANEANAFGVPEVTTAGELDAIIKVREAKGGGNRKYQSDVKIPQNVATLLDEKRNAEAMISKYNELVDEAGARPFEGMGDKGARQLSRIWQGLGGKPSKELRIYNELEALSGEILSEYIKRISGAAVSEQEAQRLAKNKPNIDMNSMQFEDQMKRYLADIEDSIAEKITTYGFETGDEMESAVRGGYIDYTPEEVDQFLTEEIGVPAGESGLLDLIGQAESEGQYNAVYGNASQQDVDFSQKSLNEVGQWQADQVTGGSPSSAVGKYQILQSTLKGLQEEMGLTGDEMFTPELQDEMAMKLLERRGWNEYVEGKITKEELQRRLSQEWASLPTDASNKSYYADDGLNKAGVTTAELHKTINA